MAQTSSTSILNRKKFDFNARVLTGEVFTKYTLGRMTLKQAQKAAKALAKSKLNDAFESVTAFLEVSWYAAGYVFVAEDNYCVCREPLEETIAVMAKM